MCVWVCVGGCVRMCAGGVVWCEHVCMYNVL